MYGGQRLARAAGRADVAVIDEQDAARIARLSDVSNRRGRDGTYGPAQLRLPGRSAAWTARTTASARRRRTAHERSGEAPVLGPVNGADLQCPLWPVESGPDPPRIDGDGAPPIVVIGTTGDPATPYEYAVSHGRSAGVGSAGDLQWRGTPGVRAERMRAAARPRVPGR